MRAPDQVNFRYRLEGFEDHWMPGNRRRAANYDNLPPGRYRFRVVAQNPAGSSEASMGLLVRPKFYQTNWFLAIGFVLAAICAAGAFALRERQAHDRYNLRLEERTRIAREMHDTIIQGCLGVSTLVEAAVGAAGADQDQMLECLDNARVHLRLTVDEARQALTDLRHGSFENDLEESLAQLCETLSSEKGVPITLEVEGSPIPLPRNTKRALVLVAREAIRNATGHGGPTNVRGYLQFGPHELRLEFVDDGCGFNMDSDRLLQSAHFGILGMRERMEQINGLLEVQSSRGAGTTISAILPITRSVLVKS